MGTRGRTLSQNGIHLLQPLIILLQLLHLGLQCLDLVLEVGLVCLQDQNLVAQEDGAGLWALVPKQRLQPAADLLALDRRLFLPCRLRPSSLDHNANHTGRGVSSGYQHRTCCQGGQTSSGPTRCCQTVWRH